MDLIRLLIADDRAGFRDSIKLLVESEADIELVGDASTINEAIEMAQTLQPDVILMDIEFRDDPSTLNGIDAVRHIIRNSPYLFVIMLTILDDDLAIFEAIRAGARGYIIKGAAKRADILRHIRTVASGEFILSPGIASRLQSFFSNIPATVVPDVFPELSAREREVLTLMTQGYTRNEQLAEYMTLSSKTIRNYVSSILSKLQVADRAQAILRAKNAGLT